MGSSTRALEAGWTELRAGRWARREGGASSRPSPRTRRLRLSRGSAGLRGGSTMPEAVFDARERAYRLVQGERRSWQRRTHGDVARGRSARLPWRSGGGERMAAARTPPAGPARAGSPITAGSPFTRAMSAYMQAATPFKSPSERRRSRCRARTALRRRRTWRCLGLALHGCDAGRHPGSGSRGHALPRRSRLRDGS